MSAFRRADALAGTVLGVLGVYVLLQARRWEFLSPEGPGPGFFPMGYGAGLVALSLLLVLGALRGKHGEAPDWRGAGRALLAWTGFVGCILALEPLGFTIAFGLFCCFLVRVVMDRPWPAALTVALLAALGFHLVFVVGLELMLPAGPLGF